MVRIDKPGAGEYAPHDQNYIALIPDDGDLLSHLRADLDAAKALFTSLPEEKLRYSYAEGKWTVKEVLGHIIDTERIFAYRTLRFARNDATELAGFEQDDYIAYSHANERGIGEMLEEFAAVRTATIALLQSLDAGDLLRGGIASGRRLTVRAAAYMIAGHHVHHMNIIKERYL